jgi:hypothetical protein
MLLIREVLKMGLELTEVGRSSPHLNARNSTWAIGLRRRARQLRSVPEAALLGFPRHQLHCMLCFFCALLYRAEFACRSRPKQTRSSRSSAQRAWPPRSRATRGSRAGCTKRTTMPSRPRSRAKGSAPRTPTTASPLRRCLDSGATSSGAATLQVRRLPRVPRAPSDGTPPQTRRRRSGSGRRSSRRSASRPTSASAGRRSRCCSTSTRTR